MRKENVAYTNDTGKELCEKEVREYEQSLVNLEAKVPKMGTQSSSAESRLVLYKGKTSYWNRGYRGNAEVGPGLCYMVSVMTEKDKVSQRQVEVT